MSTSDSPRVAQYIEPTEALLDQLVQAQAEHTAHVITTEKWGDDGGDYITSALDCAQALFSMRIDQCDLTALGTYLNTPYNDKNEYVLPGIVQLGSCATDGICPALWNLYCIAIVTAH